MSRGGTGMDAEVGRLRGRVMGHPPAAADLRALDEVRVAALGKKGAVTELVKGVSALPPERRREAGQAFNDLKRAGEGARSPPPPHRGRDPPPPPRPPRPQ